METARDKTAGTGTARDETPRNAEAARLRDALVADLRAREVLRSGPVEAALRAVPRHLFVPGIPLSQAYANDVVLTKRDPQDAPISAASQPSIVALMLEQLGVERGHNVLEIGAGTGYNAALLAHLTGPEGQVTTIEVDADLVPKARAALGEAGYPDVSVVLRDGALGYPDRAPYDRVIATVGAWDLPLAWLDQLGPAGRLVVPLRIRGSVTRSIAFERDDSLPGIPRWRGVSSEMCSFMPLRDGVADDPARLIPLTLDNTVGLAAHQDQDIDDHALREVLSRPGTAEWTGVTLAEGAAEWLFLWLACTLRNAVSRMSARQQAIDAGLVRPMPAWGTVATSEAGSLAYVTFRGHAGWPREVGVIGHGPRGAGLAREVAAEVSAWDTGYRGATVGFTLQPVTAPGPLTSQFTVRTGHTWLSVNFDLPSLNRNVPAVPRPLRRCQGGRRRGGRRQGYL
ncbi:MAG TPA: methyltransferase, FxLD system [Trebonia sp.]|nr:methyltransferase, FxLD system [Trebonia sp.]